MSLLYSDICNTQKHQVSCCISLEIVHLELFFSVVGKSLTSNGPWPWLSMFLRTAFLVRDWTLVYHCNAQFLSQLGFCYLVITPHPPTKLKKLFFFFSSLKFSFFKKRNSWDAKFQLYKDITMYTWRGSFHFSRMA